MVAVAVLKRFANYDTVRREVSEHIRVLLNENENDVIAENDVTRGRKARIICVFTFPSRKH